jgi:hypothetical protein
MGYEQPAMTRIVPNWQITASTIYCDIVDSPATIMVYKDWRIDCVHHKRWGPIRRKNKNGILGLLSRIGIGDPVIYIPSECPGPLKCSYVCGFREEFARQEKAMETQQ